MNFFISIYFSPTWPVLGTGHNHRLGNQISNYKMLVNWYYQPEYTYSDQIFIKKVKFILLRG